MILRKYHRRRLVFGVALFLVLSLLSPGVFAQGPPGGWPAILATAVVDLPVASGIQYRHMTLATADGPLDLHQMQVDLSNPTIHLGVGIARDRLMSDDETVSSMALRTGAIAGINADYFDIHESGIPLNLVIQNGQLLRSPWRWIALVIGRDGAARIIRYRWTGTVTLTTTGETRPLDGYNSGLSPNGIVLLSNIRGYGAPQPDAATRQVVAELTPPDAQGHAVVKQLWPQQPFYVPFPNDDVILVGRGAGADWLNRLATGTPVQLALTTDPDWHDAQLAVGGGPLLVANGQIATDSDPPSPSESSHRYPVIAVGIAPDARTLTFVEVDGRQPALSIGLTRPQLAAYMQRLGASEAMAFDSGGSATMVVRLPGAATPSVVNSPSDGKERPVGDAVLVYSSAVPGPPARLLVNAGQPLELFAGASAALSVIGVDAQGNPTTLTDPLQAVTSPPGLVAVGPDGTVTASTSAGSGAMTVQSGAASGTAPISVVTQLAKLVVSPATLTVAPGEPAQFTVRAVDRNGRPVIVPSGIAQWTVAPPTLGTISPSGSFVPGDAAGNGTVTATLGGTFGQARVAIGSTARYLDQFDVGAWTFRGYPDSVTGDVARVSDPSHDGHPSVALTYRLDGTGTRAAYVQTQIPLAGEPSGVSLWVYGDGSGAWLRGVFDEENGEKGTVTLAQRVDWTGWRSVTAALPPGLAFPISWSSFYVVVTDPAKTPHGVLYLSSMRAIYPGGQAK